MSDVRRESRARLGVFVVSGLVLATAGALALGAARIFERTVPLHCYFRETVQGLDPGSPVSYRGVQLGRVSQVRMRPRATGAQDDDRAVIEVIADLDPDQLARFGSTSPSDLEVREAIRREVAKGLRVRIVWKDITGQKFLDLEYYDPEEDVARAPDLGFMPEEPYVPVVTEKSLTDIQRDLSATLSSLAKIDYASIGARVQLLLDETGRKVSELRTDEISVAFRDAARAMTDTFRGPELQRAIARLDSVTSELETLGRRANDLLAKPEVEQAITDLGATARSFRTTAETLETSLPKTVARIDGAVEDTRKAIVDAKLAETTAAVRDGVRDVSGAARGVAAVREDLHGALRDLAEASRSIARLAEYLERHPDALLGGRREPQGGSK